MINLLFHLWMRFTISSAIPSGAANLADGRHRRRCSAVRGQSRMRPDATGIWQTHRMKLIRYSSRYCSAVGFALPPGHCRIAACRHHAPNPPWRSCCPSRVASAASRRRPPAGEAETPRVGAASCWPERRRPLLTRLDREREREREIEDVSQRASAGEGEKEERKRKERKKKEKRKIIIGNK
jgi:hypothetical protein